MNEHYTRRRFLKRLAVLTSAATLLPFAAEIVHAAPVSVGKVADFKPGEWKSVKLPNGDAAYVRRLPGRSSRFQALSAACTHKGCPVAWRNAEKQFVCPCHGGRFDADGRNIAGPPPKPLAALPVKIAHGQVIVSV